MQETQQKAKDMSFLLDIPIALTIELGRRRMSIEEVLNLTHGSIIELNKGIKEPLEVIVNGKAIAKGELVEAEEQLAVRIVEISNPSERIKEAMKA